MVGAGSLQVGLKTRLSMGAVEVLWWKGHFRKTNLVATCKIFWKERDYRTKKGRGRRTNNG